jgi:Uma2 family endonuclease
MVSYCDQEQQMPSPFPGMDPYLEDPVLWPDVHARFIIAISELLTPRLRPQYVARVEQYAFVFDSDEAGEQLYIVPDVKIVEQGLGARVRDESSGVATIPMAEPIDVTGLIPQAVRQRYIEIRDPTSREVITVIEVVSPSNKRKGATGRRRFLEKRQEVSQARTSWLEIDLLREGERTIALPRRVPRLHYLAYGDRTVGDVDDRAQWAWPINLRQRLPVLKVPLRPGEQDVPLDLQAALDALYQRAGYDVDVDYSKPPKPPLEGDDARWAEELLGRRRGTASDSSTKGG